MNAHKSSLTEILSALIFVCALVFLLLALFCVTNISAPQVAISVLALLLIYLFFRKFGVPRAFPVILLIASFCLYCAFAAALDNPVIQDFLRQYEAAESFMKGNASAFSTEYFGKYPYQIGWSLVESVLLAIWNSAACVKLFCCICVSLTVLLTYAIAKELTNDAAAATAGCGVALYPSVLLMPGSCSNQPLSTLLCFVGFYLIICRGKNRASFADVLGRVLAAGVLFAFAEMIRPDVIVIVLAGMLALIIKDFVAADGMRETILKRLTAAVSLFAAYKLTALFLTSAIVAAGLAATFDTDVMYKIALGTNLESGGAWSAEVFERIDEKKAAGLGASEAALAVVWENLDELSDPGALFSLVESKNQLLWWGSGFYFSTLNASGEVYDLFLHLDNSMLLIGIVLCLASVIGLLARRRECANGYMFLLLTLLATLAAYQIIEVQPRYFYTEFFVLFILAADGIEAISCFVSRCWGRLRASRRTEGER